LRRVERGINALGFEFYSLSIEGYVEGHYHKLKKAVVGLDVLRNYAVSKLRWALGSRSVHDEDFAPVLWSLDAQSVHGDRSELFNELIQLGFSSGGWVKLVVSSEITGYVIFGSKVIREPSEARIASCALLKDRIIDSCMPHFGTGLSLKDKPSLPTLTAQEKEVIRWCLKGKTSWETGKILGCSEANVNYHFGKVRKKLGVTSKISAIAKLETLGSLGCFVH